MGLRWRVLARLVLALLSFSSPRLCAERLAMVARRPGLQRIQVKSSEQYMSPFKKRCCQDLNSDGSSVSAAMTIGLKLDGDVVTPSRPAGKENERKNDQEIAGQTAYRLTFGRYAGKTLSEVPDDYLQWLMRSEILVGRPGLHHALTWAGRLSQPHNALVLHEEKASVGTSIAPLKANATVLRGARISGLRSTASRSRRKRHLAEVTHQQPIQSSQVLTLSTETKLGEYNAAKGGQLGIGTKKSASDAIDKVETEKDRKVGDGFGDTETEKTSCRPAGEGGTTGRASHAWRSAAKHVHGLRKAAVTEFFGRRGVRGSLTGVHHFNRSKTLSKTPSPGKEAAAGAVRDALSSVQQSLPRGIRAAGCLRLQARFVRPLPASSTRYTERLRAELEIIAKCGFEECFLQVLEVLEAAAGLPYLVRGSAAGSLVCYLLGISHLDPVRERLSLSRFLNALREELPDVDLDFPHDQRDSVFERLFQRFPASAARISNHLHFRPRSAKREAARRLNHRHPIPREKSPGDYFVGPVREVYEAEWQRLVGSFRGYSLHCGGMVIMAGGEESIPPAEYVPETNPHAYTTSAASLATTKRKFPLQQVKWDKRDCQRRGHLKIDILANRALTHLWRCSSRHVYEYPSSDSKTAALLLNADTTGILYCESPAMKKALRLLRPTSRRELALALAIIRPAGRSARRLNALPRVRSAEAESLVFDEDAIEYIQRLVGCSEDTAEMLRKGCGKGNTSCMDTVETRLRENGRASELENLVEHSKQYSFCKSHALSYAHLTWALAFEKAHNLKAFWQAHSTAVAAEGFTVYRPWVYKRASILAGIRQPEEAQGRIGRPLTSFEQYRLWGYWIGNDFLQSCHVLKSGSYVAFRGLFATGRLVGNRTLFITLGVANGKFVDIHADAKESGHGRQIWQADVIEGQGYWRTALGSHWIEAKNVTSVTWSESKIAATK